MKRQVIILSAAVLSAASLAGCSAASEAEFEDKLVYWFNNGRTKPETETGEEETETAQQDIFMDSEDETVESGEDMIEPEAEDGPWQYDDGQVTYLDNTEQTYETNENGESVTNEDGSFLNIIPTVEFETRETTVSPDASMDDNGEYHFGGYHLSRKERETLPPSAIVGAEINYDIYRKGETELETSETEDVDENETVEETRQQIVYVTQPETRPAPTTAAPTTAAPETTKVPETTKAPTSPEDDPELIAQRITQ